MQQCTSAGCETGPGYIGWIWLPVGLDLQWLHLSLNSHLFLEMGAKPLMCLWTDCPVMAITPHWSVYCPLVSEVGLTISLRNTCLQTCLVIHQWPLWRHWHELLMTSQHIPTAFYFCQYHQLWECLYCKFTGKFWWVFSFQINVIYVATVILNIIL